MDENSKIKLISDRMPSIPHTTTLGRFLFNPQRQTELLRRVGLQGHARWVEEWSLTSHRWSLSEGHVCGAGDHSSSVTDSVSWKSFFIPVLRSYKRAVRPMLAFTIDYKRLQQQSIYKRVVDSTLLTRNTTKKEDKYIFK